MLEKQLAKDFNTMFKEYHIMSPQERAAGWPDKGIQISGSRIVWFELKIVQLRYGSNTFRIGSLTAHQCAWLAKWQMFGGFCFVFIGFTDYEDNFIKYGILRVGRWDLWPKVRQQPILLEQLVVYTDNQSDIVKWFKDLFISQGTRPNTRQ